MGSTTRGRVNRPRLQLGASCIRGHLMTPDTLYTTKDGTTMCRVCRLERVEQQKVRAQNKPRPVMRERPNKPKTVLHKDLARWAAWATEYVKKAA